MSEEMVEMCEEICEPVEMCEEICEAVEMCEETVEVCEQAVEVCEQAVEVCEQAVEVCEQAVEVCEQVVEVCEQAVEISEQVVEISEVTVEISEDDNKEVFGGVEGPNSQFVKLISCDGHEFIIERKYLSTSVTIMNMLGGPGTYAETEINQIHFREIPSCILQKVCQYFVYKVHYSNNSEVIPDFPIADNFALELLMVSNFLNC